VQCLARFKKGLLVETGKALCGWPENTTLMLAFEKLCDCLKLKDYIHLVTCTR
jgi:hypothetical protein